MHRDGNGQAKGKMMGIGREKWMRRVKQMGAMGDKKETGTLMGEDSREVAEKQKALSIDRKMKRASVMHGEEEGG